jgi:hypothetical protein
MRPATHHLAWPMLLLVAIAAALSSPAPALEAIAAVPDLPAMEMASRGALADNLIILGNQLGDLGRHEEALPLTEEGVAMFRALAEEKPAFRARQGW